MKAFKPEHLRQESEELRLHKEDLKEEKEVISVKYTLIKDELVRLEA
jgi:hypothetical protein